MTYKNKYQTSLKENFLNSLTTIRPLAIILLLIIIIFTALFFSTTMSKNAINTFLILIGIISASVIYGIVLGIFKIWPNEKSVTFSNNYMIINYPYFKESQQIPFSEINYITVHRSRRNPESLISIKSKKSIYGLNEEIISVSSLTSTDWREVSLVFKIPVIIHNEIEEKVIKKWGFFLPKFIEINDYYVLKKSFDNTDQTIDNKSWEEYTQKNAIIKFLGKEELINVSDDKLKSGKLQYSLETDNGIFGIDFFDGMLVATYEKDKKPIYLEKIARDLNLELKKLKDIK